MRPVAAGLFVLGASVLATVLMTGVARADDPLTIKRPGAHVSYFAELEPHGVARDERGVEGPQPRRD